MTVTQVFYVDIIKILCRIIEGKNEGEYREVGINDKGMLT